MKYSIYLIVISFLINICSPPHAYSNDAALDALFSFSILPETIFQGDVFLFKISPASTISFAECVWDNQTVFLSDALTAGSYSGFFAVDLEASPGIKTIHCTIKGHNGTLLHRSLQVTVLKKEFPLQKLTLPESQVTLSAENQARHEHEQIMLENIFKHSRHEKLWDKCFTVPLDSEITTPFGVRRRINNKPRQPHTGLDFKAAAGTPIHAAASGIVVFTGNLFFSGNTVIIDHGTGIMSMYGHLETISVTIGSPVSLGQIIGTVGATGRATGPHLHWSMRVNNQRVNPLSLLNLCHQL